VIASAVTDPGLRNRPGVRRPRPHPTYRRAEPGTDVFRPGDLAERPVGGVGTHRTRRSYARCDNPRAAARAAAVRRRHILLGVLALVLLLVLASPWSGRGSDGLTAPGPAQPTLTAHATYIVQRGDTLWSIAERLSPEGDPRPLMTAMSAQVGGDTLRPGERLILP
jgi:nucleoid-associated protein YgaU